MPAAVKSKPPTEFSLVSLIRSLCKDSELKPGEGDHELTAVARASEQLAKFSDTTLRGHVIPITRAESGGITSGMLSTGGALISGSVSLAATLQPVLHLERLGARRVQGNAGDLLVSPPAAVAGWWLGEDQDAPDSEALLGTAMMAPKEAAVRIRMSRRLFKQAGQIAEQEFRSLIQRSIAETIEAGILNGTGANAQPLGMLNDEQLQQETFTSSTGLPSREKTAEFIGEILEAGGDLEQIQILLSAADYEASQLRVDSTGGDSALVEISDGRRRLAGVPVAFSEHVPTGRLIVADWSRVVVSYVGPPQLIVNPYTESSSGTLLMTLFQQVSYAVERRELLTVATLTES
jgi:HK97 family phage major capsid protein